MSRESMMRKLGLTESDFKAKPKPMEVVEITREDFDLLEIEQEVIYYIFEEDGSITVRKGENV